jgi:hypothetical protein
LGPQQAPDPSPDYKLLQIVTGTEMRFVISFPKFNTKLGKPVTQKGFDSMGSVDYLGLLNILLTK